MGFLGDLLSRIRGRCPVIDDAHPASRHLGPLSAALSDLARRTGGRFEVVPSERGAYVFVGKPPKDFRLVWIEGGTATHLEDFVAQRRLDVKAATNLLRGLAEAYQRSSGEQRFRAMLGGRAVVVAPSPHLARELKLVLERGAGGPP